MWEEADCFVLCGGKKVRFPCNNGINRRLCFTVIAKEDMVELDQ